MKTRFGHTRHILNRSGKILLCISVSDVNVILELSTFDPGRQAKAELLRDRIWAGNSTLPCVCSPSSRSLQRAPINPRLGNDQRQDASDEIQRKPSRPPVSSRDPGLNLPTPYTGSSPVLPPLCSGGAAAAVHTQLKLSTSSPCWVWLSSWCTRCGYPGSIPLRTEAVKLTPPSGTRVDNIQPGGSRLVLS